MDITKLKHTPNIRRSTGMDTTYLRSSSLKLSSIEGRKENLIVASCTATENTKAMDFLLQSSKNYDGIRRELHNNMVKGNNEYPSTVTYAYNMLLEWTPDPSSVRGGEVHRDVPYAALTNVGGNGDEEPHDNKF